MMRYVYFFVLTLLLIDVLFAKSLSKREDKVYRARRQLDAFSSFVQNFQKLFGGGDFVQSGNKVIVDSNKVGTQEGTMVLGSGYQKGGGVGYQNGTLAIGDGLGVFGLGQNVFGNTGKTNINFNPNNAGGCTGKNIGVFGANIFTQQNCLDLPIIGQLLGGGKIGSPSGSTSGGFLDQLLFGGKRRK